MERNHLIQIAAIFFVAIVVNGCGPSVQESKTEDFAGVSFAVTRSDLEAKKFICKDEDGENQGFTTCTNFDFSSTLFGMPTKKQSVRFGPGKNVQNILVEMSPLVAQTTKLLELESSIRSVYAKNDSLPGMDSEVVHMRSWIRPDGSELRLNVFEGIRGIMEPRVHLVAHRKPEQSTTMKEK